MDTTKKIVALITIITLIGGFVFGANQTRAASAILYFTKEFVIKPLVRALANALENKIVNKMTAQINGVSQGQPSFITNWRNQILDSQGKGNDVFRAVLADTKLCPYFDQNLKSAFGADKYAGAIAGATVKNAAGQVVYQNKTTVPGMASFQQIANCTLSSDIVVSEFEKDFSKGGWAAWDQLIQPQNNFYGIYTMAVNEQQKQIQTESQSSRDQSLAGGGYLGQKLGLSGGADPNGCVGAGSGGLNRCIFVGKEVTPPKLIAELNATALGTKISRAGFGSELNDVVEGLIGAVVTGLLNNMTNFLGMKSYSQLLQTGLNAFDESGANQPVPSNLYNPQTVCEDACNADYNSCMQQNSPAQNASASGNYTGVCSDALNTCIANCSSQTVTPAGQ